MEKRITREIRKLIEKLGCCKANVLLASENGSPLLTGEDVLEIRTIYAQSLSNIPSTRELNPLKQKTEEKNTPNSPGLKDSSFETFEKSPSLTDRIFATESTSLNFHESFCSHFFKAVELGDEETVRVLCGKQQNMFKIDVNCKNLHGESPLHVAAKKGNLNICESLVKAGFDVDSLDLLGRTALHLACINSRYRVVQLLVRTGSMIHMQDNLGNTPLHYAISQQEGKIVKYLMNRFPDLNIKNKSGITAQDLITLHGVSVENTSFSVVESLTSEEEEKISQKDFEAVQVLGRGSYAEVYLVKMAGTEKLFAMKVLRKEKMLQQNLVRYAITERNILTKITHPFIAKLNYAFQSDDKLNLVLDFYSGGSLSFYLSKEKHFTEDMARFYLSEIVLALEELHRNSIVYRDLKPDNVLIDEHGHAVLTDFGLSKEGISDEDLTSSFCGSLAYLAPEMIKQTGHGKSVDWYLLGVLLYEMVIGFPPFYSVNREQMFKNIENSKIRIPARVSAVCKNLIKTLMKKDPAKRLGSLKGAEEVKRHPFFSDVDWNEVMKKNRVGPIVPRNRVVPGNVPNYYEKEKPPEEIDLRYLSNWTFIKTR